LGRIDTTMLERSQPFWGRLLPPGPDSTLAERIKWLREEDLRVDARALARRLEAYAVRGADHSSIGKYETGKTVPSGPFLAALALEANIDGHWLLTGDGAPRRQPAESVEKGYQLISGIVHAIEDDPETIERMWLAWELRRNAEADAAKRDEEGPAPQG
jgi:transcriptional regulator with XRE-family HTH domain